MNRHFEPYLLTIAGLFALAAALSPDRALSLGLAYMAGAATFAAWCYAHAPLVEG